MKRIVLIFAIALAGTLCMSAAAQADFGLDQFDVSFTGEDGSPATQAGSHPFAFTTSFAANVDGGEPQGRLQELFIDEIPGLAIDPLAVPRCREEDFETLDEGVNGCSDASAVGIFQGAAGSPGNWATTPIFSLVPPPGVLMRLGFRMADTANVIVDFELSPETPYRLLASVGEIPESIELFAAKLQLWGVPSSPPHDEFRGRCVVDGVEGSCPTTNPQVPFLTLPTSCDGAQATYFEALSWGGNEDFGDAFTHDGVGNPLGFLGCHRLSFNPFFDLHPTTVEAQSPTGIDFSLDLSGEGLSDPMGIAESQIRDLVVSLPGGMTTGPSLALASGSCSESGLDAETPAGVPGEGCPASSIIGTVEAESPLLEGERIGGAIYRATPHENFAGDAAVALYLVLRDPDLGIVIAQPVSLETDSATGRLVAIAEEMPQLPFSRLRLHLDDGESGPLVSPTLCNGYTVDADFETWSGEGPFRATSSFPIVSGPNGGPCPTGARETQQGETAGSSPVAGTAVVSSGPGGPRRRASTRRRCRNGSHRVRRHGKVRCVKNRHRKHQRRSR